MGIKRVIATILNIQDGKPAAEGNYDYLKEALTKGSTTTEGGLILSNVLAVKRTDGSVASYINGLTGNPTALAAGVQNFGLANETKKIALNHNGSGYLASGKINWDAQGNAVIGGFYILSDRLSSSQTGTGRRTDILANGDIAKYDEDGVITSLESSASGVDEKIYYIKDGNGNAVAATKMGAYGFKTLGSPESLVPVRILKVSSNSKTNPPTGVSGTLVNYTKLLISNYDISQITYDNLNTDARYYTPPKDANGNVIVGSYPEGYVQGVNYKDIFVDNGWYLLDGYATFGTGSSYTQKIYYVENGQKLDNVFVSVPVYQETVDVYISVDVSVSGANNNYQIEYRSVFSDSSYFNEQINCVFNLSGFGGSNDGNKNIVFTEFAHNVTNTVFHDPIVTSSMSTSKYVVLQSQDKFLIYANSKYYFVRIHNYQNQI